jgi:hypothetical protein
MNLVIGPNEAGKSTIAEAVPAVLFGTDRLERFKPWGRNVCSAALFFEGRGRTVKIKRNLITDEVELLEKDDLYHILSQFSGKVPLRGRSASCREYRALLESLLGVADEGLFRATYFFGHHPQEWSGEDLAQKLRTLVSGSAEADYAEILDALLDEHFLLTRSNPWGRDKKRDREYEDVCGQLANQGAAEAVPIFVEIDRSADIEAEIEKLSGEFESDRQEHEKGLRYIESVRRKTVESSVKTTSTGVEAQSKDKINPQAKDKINPQPKDKKSLVSDVALSAQLAAVGLPKNPPRELPELLADAAKIRQELAALQPPFSALNSREKKIPKVPWIVLLSVFMLFVAGAAVAWWQSFYLLWILSGCGLCCSSLLGWGSWRHLTRKKALADCSNERGRLDRKKLEVQKRQAFLSERCEALGLPSSAIDLVKLQKLVTVHHDLLMSWWEQGDLSAAEIEVCQNESISGHDDTVLSHDDTVCDYKDSVGENSPENAEENGRELHQLESRMTEFETELKQKESRLQVLRLQLKGLLTGQNPEIETSVISLQYRKRDLEERILVFRKAINLLAGAVDEFGRLHLAGLNKEVSKLLGKITGGRYSAMSLDENMAPSLQVDGRRWVPVEHFSKGTVDAIYLALRIALAKVRDDGRSLPLMLDDPFVHLDQKRLATALNMVDLASADGQLILFSHNLDLGKRAARERWHVVPLDGGDIDTTQEEGGDHAGQLHLL